MAQPIAAACAEFPEHRIHDARGARSRFAGARAAALPIELVDDRLHERLGTCDGSAIAISSATPPRVSRIGTGAVLMALLL